MKPNTNNNRGYQGFSLIEVLVTLVVLSIGLLGLAMLQLESLKHNTDAYFRTQATMLAYEIIDRMRANGDAARNGSYVAAAAPADEDCGDLGGTGCDSQARLANYDLSVWYNKLAAALPADATPSSITQVGNQITVTIRWKEREVSKQRDWVVEL
ncbi:MAG: type IV pilus modification protein PilV [Sulfurifustis sp.]